MLYFKYEKGLLINLIFFQMNDGIFLLKNIFMKNPTFLPDFLINTTKNLSGFRFMFEFHQQRKTQRNCDENQDS